MVRVIVTFVETGAEELGTFFFCHSENTIWSKHDSQVKEHFKNELIEVTQTLEDHQAQIDDITMRHNDLEQYDRRLN
ncbi:unnamed protein product, partial [Didymodactylos carnosus]